MTTNERPYDQPATQSERRAIIEAERTSTTYFAQAAADNETAGRYAKASPMLTGSTAAPVKLPSPQWCADAALVPTEPSLGIDINEVPDLGMPAQPSPSIEPEALAALMERLVRKCPPE